LHAASAGLGWTSISVELWSHGACAASGVLPPAVEVCLITAGNDECLARKMSGGTVQEAVPRTGAIWLNPANLSKDVEITAHIPEAVHLHLPRALFDRLKDDFDLPNLAIESIQDAVGIRDDTIEFLGRSILSEMKMESSASRMFVEMASLTLASRLLQKYCDSGVCAARETSTHRLDSIRLSRVIDFIYTNISRDITLDHLARIAGYSPFHFARKFTVTMGIAPYRYISKVRLQIAMTELSAGKLPLAEIAFNAKFSSQASFTRAFHRAAGMTPMEYRRRRS
jgi:AraC family transcriptional regulator